MVKFIRLYTFATASEHLDMGLEIEPIKVEIRFNPTYVVHVEAKSDEIGGCEIRMLNGECFYVEETVDQVCKMIETATKYVNYPAAN